MFAEADQREVQAWTGVRRDVNLVHARWARLGSNDIFSVPEILEKNLVNRDVANTWTGSHLDIVFRVFTAPLVNILTLNIDPFETQVLSYGT